MSWTSAHQPPALENKTRVGMVGVGIANGEETKDSIPMPTPIPTPMTSVLMGTGSAAAG